jgi:hypothetical protein
VVAWVVASCYYVDFLKKEKIKQRNMFFSEAIII